MGFLKLFFNTTKPQYSDGVSSSLLKFLTETDALYMEAYVLKSIRRVGNNLSRDCALRLQSSVLSNNIRYFGDDNYRTTRWTYLSKDNNGVISILKEVTFDKIKISGRLSVSVSSDYTEKWYVSTDKEYKVIHIEKIK